MTVKVKFFTAPVKAKLSPRGNQSCIAQQDYLLALQSHCDDLEIVEGKYSTVPGSYHPDPGKGPVDFGTKLKVIRPEEKQTDVNIALHMLADATDRICDQQVLFSNDSDCMPALSMIRERHPALIIGVIAPILKESQGSRRPSGELQGHAHWMRRTISEQELASSQLPDSVATRKRKIMRPDYWR